MKRVCAVIGGIILMVLVCSPCLLGAQEEPKKVPVIREAEEDLNAAVAVEGYLIDGLFEVRVSVWMKGQTPKITNVLLVGPGIGRISPNVVKQLYATEEEEGAYETYGRGGFLTFEERTKTKKMKGRVKRKLVKFKIPRDDLRPGKRYQLWVRVESAKKRGRNFSYKFDLENFPELVTSQ
jgi:hypothetical protein